MVVKSKKRDPKVGTGKKPKGSSRRLYTDENPKDTVPIKYATPADASSPCARLITPIKPNTIAKPKAATSKTDPIATPLNKLSRSNSNFNKKKI